MRLSEEIHRLLHLTNLQNSIYGLTTNWDISVYVSSEIQNLTSKEFRANYTEKVKGFNNRRAYEHLTGKRYISIFESLVKAIASIIVFPITIILRTVTFLFTPKFYKHFVVEYVIKISVAGALLDVLMYSIGKGSRIVMPIIEAIKNLF